MADDFFDAVLGLEDNFYQEGFDAGVADGEHAGLVEGKAFGIERGYDKAMELGRLHGRSLTWQKRQAQHDDSTPAEQRPTSLFTPTDPILLHALNAMPELSKSARFVKHVDILLALTNPSTVPTKNTDEAVETLEDRLIKSTSKAKIVANTIGEPFDPSTANVKGIEDSTGLSARH